MSNYDLSAIFGARTDSYAKAQGAFVLSDVTHLLADVGQVWDFVRSLNGRMFRVIYECLDGKRLDIIGRQGVHDSAQDGEVQGIGHAMASAERLTLSFWTATHEGRKVNTGAGKGYRTIRAAGILAIRVDGTDILTSQGQAELLDSLASAR